MLYSREGDLCIRQGFGVRKAKCLTFNRGVGCRTARRNCGYATHAQNLVYMVLEILKVVVGYWQPSQRIH